MSKTEKLIFCELPETPREFDIKKFKDGDPEQNVYAKLKKNQIIIENRSTQIV